MTEAVSFIHLTGSLICVSAISLAVIVSCLVLRLRGRVDRLWVNEPSSRPVSARCKVCRQLAWNVPSTVSQDYRTIEWTCSACSGYRDPTKVRYCVKNSQLCCNQCALCSWNIQLACNVWFGMKGNHWAIS